MQGLAMVLSATLLPGVVAAQEPQDRPAKVGVELSYGLPVSMPEELYGASRLAEAADKYRLAVGDPNCPGDVSFIVAGEVSSPGEYNLKAPVNLLNALLTAGGPTHAGSMRRIQVFHDGSLLGEYDLYGFFNEGRIVDDFVFNGGEHIVVMPHGARVSVTGSVAAPAVFELKPVEMSLQHLMEYCGGFSAGEGIYRIEVVRVENLKRNIVFSSDVKSDAKLPDFRLVAGDRVSVYKKVDKLPGMTSVQFPDGSRREFSLDNIARLSHLLKELEPLSENVSVSYAELLRVVRSDKKYEVIGISIEALSRMIAAGDTSFDLVLRPDDRLMLFDREFIEKKPIVGLEVSGQAPVFTDYKAGMKISDLLRAIEVELPGRAKNVRINRRRLSGAKIESSNLLVDISAVRRGSRRHDVELQPFDVLMIQP